MNEILGQGLLTARDAAAELGISVATLYAYVSRGMIRSEIAADGRGRRYRAEDIQVLRTKRAPPDPETEPHQRIWDGPVLDSAITQMSENGPAFRGALAIDLAKSGATFEHVCEVLWDAVQLQPFSGAGPSPFPKTLAPVVAALDGWPPTDRAAAVMALASHVDPSAHRRSAAGAADTSARIVRWMTALMSGQAPSVESAHSVLARRLAPNRKEAAGLIRHALVLLADHELNASTFTARVAASTGISLYDAVAAGLTALKGSHHGGATTRAARFVAAVSEKDGMQEIRARAALNEPVPGFGHALYRDRDPRAAALLQAMTDAGIKSPLISDIPLTVFEMIGDRPNIDYALAVMGRVLALPEGGEIAVLALARTAGWLAHAREQFMSGQLIRPRARYTGPALRGSVR